MTLDFCERSFSKEKNNLKESLRTLVDTFFSTAVPSCSAAPCASLSPRHRLNVTAISAAVPKMANFFSLYILS